MQYLVEASHGPLPGSPQQALELLEGTVIPHFDYMIRLKSEGKMLAGGLRVGERAFVCIIEAASNDEADRIVRDMPLWAGMEWKVTPLQSVEGRKTMEQATVQALRTTRS
jgi:muconolactone delta-isomerase